MSFAIKRPEAETARRRAIAIAKLPNPALCEAERRACVAIWNEFCASEQARLDAKDAAAEQAERAAQRAYLLRTGGWS